MRPADKLQSKAATSLPLGSTRQILSKTQSNRARCSVYIPAPASQGSVICEAFGMVGIASRSTLVSKPPVASRRHQNQQTAGNHSGIPPSMQRSSCTLPVHAQENNAQHSLLAILSSETPRCKVIHLEELKLRPNALDKFPQGFPHAQKLLFCVPATPKSANFFSKMGVWGCNVVIHVTAGNSAVT